MAHQIYLHETNGDSISLEKFLHELLNAFEEKRDIYDNVHCLIALKLPRGLDTGSLKPIIKRDNVGNPWLQWTGKLMSLYFHVLFPKGVELADTEC